MKIRNTTTALFIFSMLLFVQYVIAQRDRIRFEKLSIENGLSQSSVVTICQDHKGFIWLGTYDGLNRYDGYDFKVFKHRIDDSTSISHNLIRKIFEDHHNNLWIGTEGGLNRYDREKEIFIRYSEDLLNPKSISNNRIRDIYEDSNGELWIATEGGLNKYDRENNSFLKFYSDPKNPNSLSANLIRAICEDSLGNFYIGTNDGLNIFDRKNKKITHIKNNPNNINSLSHNNIISLTADGEGNLWIGTGGGGLNKFNIKQNTFSRYKFDPKNEYSLRNNFIRAVYLDKQGELWVGTYGGGLEKYDKKSNGFIHYQHNSNDPHSLGSNAIWSIYEDRSGILWIGTDFGGVNKYDRRKSQFTHYTNDPNNPLSLNKNEVNAFYSDLSDSKIIWIGTLGGGLSEMNIETEVFIPYKNSIGDPNSLSNDNVRCIKKDKSGLLWVGTDDGLNVFRKENNKLKRVRLKSDLENLQISIRTIYEDMHGNIWIGTYRGGLYKYNPLTNQFKHYQHNPIDSTSISDNIVWCIFEDRSGRLWVGTDAGGLNLKDRNEDKFSHYKKTPNNISSISDNKILCLEEDRTGFLWIGTAGAGLCRFDPDQNIFKNYTEENGLTSNTIQAIVEDNQENLWISTTNGLSRLNKERTVFTNYYEHDGLQSNEFNVGACCKGVNGDLFFGGINGFNKFTPNKIEQDSFVPTIVLTNFQLFGKSVQIGKEIDGRIILKKSIAETQEIILDHGDDIFSIEFAALDFSAPSKNLYSYRIKGLEKEWSFPSNRRYATYTKLPSGKYVFSVKGSNENGVWNEKAISLNIIITPPFWEEWWFRLIIIFLVMSALFLSYKLRTARIIEQNQQLQKRVAERTSELEAVNKELEAFAYSISHDLRTPLRAIDGYTHILLEDHLPYLNEQGKYVCGVISRETRRMNQLIDDFLTLSRTSYTNMQKSEINMEELVRSVFDDLTKIENKERIDFLVGSLPTAYGDPVLIREVWVNLISNALKFSSKKERAKIEISCSQDGQNNVYIIKDNGVGFDMRFKDKLFGVFQRLHSENEFEGTGVGLAIVDRIIKRHGGKIWAESEIGNGATFYFIIKQKGDKN